MSCTRRSGSPSMSSLHVCRGRRSTGPSMARRLARAGRGSLILQRSELRLHLYLRGTDTLVGSSGLQRIDWEVPKFEIGYWCRTGFTGRGYITEAVLGITEFAFDALGARRVEIRCDSRNLPSARVAERAGFELEARLNNNEVSTDGEPKNTLIYALTR